MGRGGDGGDERKSVRAWCGGGDVAGGAVVVAGVRQAAAVTAGVAVTTGVTVTAGGGGNGRRRR